MASLLLISERYSPDVGGVARSARRTAEQLAYCGHQVHVLAWTKLLAPGQLDSRPTTDGVHVHRLGLFSNWDFSLQHTMNVVEWMHQQRGFHAVWGHYLYPAGFMAVLFGTTHGVPSIVSARGNDVDRLMFPPGDFARLQWTLQRCQVVTAVSRDLASKIQVLVGTERPVHVVPNSVDIELFSPGDPDAELRAKLGIAPPESVLGFCGELRHKKGAPFLLSALHHVRLQRPACLLLIGEIRVREQSMLTEYLAEQPEAGRRVIVTGNLEDPVDVARHLRLCDVVLHPSVWDGMPNAVLEAMSCGRLVIGSDAGGIPEVVTHGENGFLIPRAQLHRLGEGILEVLDLPAAERDRVSAAARQRIATDFHAEAEREQLRRVMDELLRMP